MARCFVSYSESYRPLMELVKRLLETLEFQVDVSDGPDLDRPAVTVAQQRIAAADCVVLLLGPKNSENNRADVEPAHWPAEEGVWAISRDKPKPLAMVLHPGTRVPESLRIMQTPVRFDFWDQTAILNNVHHLVKHLLDLKRRVDLPPGDQPFIYTKATVRHKIQRDKTQLIDVYHEAVPRQEWSRFHHALDTGMDRRSSARVELVSPDAYDIEATLNPGRHQVKLQFDEITERSVAYFVDVDPPLLPGERLGYRREFVIKSIFPVTRDELLEMAAQEGFPDLYKADGRVYYGELYDVFYDMESVLISIQFPRRFPLRAKRALAYSINTKTLNVVETERCNSPECLTLEEPPDGDRILTLAIRRPIINHQYALLYEPAT
jgi:hypothetical protein